MKLFGRRRTVIVYLDGRKALKFKRARGANGERVLHLVRRAPNIPEETVRLIREDILRRWTWRDEER
jgi:hypothetical protein